MSTTLPQALEPLTTKPVVQIVNGGEGGFDLALEAELSELTPEEAAEFRDGPSGFDKVLSNLFETVGLLTFFTAATRKRERGRFGRGAPRSTPPRRSIPTSPAASSAAR